jgi:tocopherol O-methyltransferase
VGCGLGGSSFWLARHLGCSVLGITISPAQYALASARAREEGLAGRVSFAIQDANRLDLLPQTFDIIWVVECSEHLADKAGFIRCCARLLEPGGRLALCTWLAGSGSGHAALVAEVCRRMLVPSLARLADQVHWMEAAGFTGVRAEDVTRQVERTWDHCQAILGHPDLQAVLPHLDAPTRDFLGGFEVMRRGYASGALRYGMFTAVRSV